MSKGDARQDETREEVEEQSVEQAASLSPHMIYEVIRRDGEEELARTRRSLFWSGIAAGMLISLSVLGEAVLRTYLPDTPSRYLVENIGYSLGFLAVITSRVQLFTENTITTVLPVMRQPTLKMLGAMLRLWGIVLGANVIGGFAAAALFVFTPALPVDIMTSVTALSEHAMSMSASVSFWRGIPAGVIIALIVWMLPQAAEAKFFIIMTFTWLIAAGDFTHIVAGSVEMAVLMLQGELAVKDAITGFFVPVLAGNVMGGTVVFTLVAWGQVRDDVKAGPKDGVREFNE